MLLNSDNPSITVRERRIDGFVVNGRLMFSVVCCVKCKGGWVMNSFLIGDVTVMFGFNLMCHGRRMHVYFGTQSETKILKMLIIISLLITESR